MNAPEHPDNKTDSAFQSVCAIYQRRDGMDNETKMMFELIIDKIDKMDSHFGTIDRRLDAIDKRLDAMDERFDGIDRRLDAMDERFDGIDRRLDAMDERFDGIDRRLDAMDEQFNVINGRLDRLESTVGHIKARQDRDSRKLTDLQLQIQVFERDVKRNFARVNDAIDTIVEILKLNGLIPQ